MLEHFYLNCGLVMESFLVANYLHCNKLVVFVVKALQRLSKASLAQEVNHLVTVANMVVHNHLIVAFLIIEPVVKPSGVFIKKECLLVERRSFDFLCL